MQTKQRDETKSVSGLMWDLFWKTGYVGAYLLSRLVESDSANEAWQQGKADLEKSSAVHAAQS